jgi:hypothetical protein
MLPAPLRSATANEGERMARVRRGRRDVPETAKLGAFLVFIGAVLGLMRGHGLVTGIVAGALLFATVVGIGTFAGWVRRRFKA